MTIDIRHEGDLGASLRDVMADVCTPVAIVTSCVETTPFGSTVSAFCSLSMNPPMVMVALNRESDTLRALKASGRFGVNILGIGNADLAMQFARKGPDKFDGVTWTTSHGVPRIDTSPGWIACDVAGLAEGGDHLIISGNVVGADLRHSEPLTYHQRRFGTHVPFRVEQ